MNPTLPGPGRDDAADAEAHAHARGRRFLAGLGTAWVVVAIVSALSAGVCLAAAWTNLQVGRDGAGPAFGWVGSAVNAGVFALIAATVAAFCRLHAERGDG